MTTESQQSSSSEQNSKPFGTRLQAAREALGYERKEVAAQLRLNEKVIIMMEKDRYPADLPVTFVRGYIRSYSKFLQIPESEIAKTLASIKHKPSKSPILNTTKPIIPVTSDNYFMRFFTLLIIVTMAALVGIWLYTHPNITSAIVLEPTTSNMIMNSAEAKKDKQIVLTSPIPVINPSNSLELNNKDKSIELSQNTKALEKNPTPKTIVKQKALENIYNSDADYVYTD